MMYKQYNDIERGTVQNPVGTYKYLKYQAWVTPISAVTAVPVRVGGVATQSPPGRILTASDVQLREGTPSFTVAAPYKSFGLYDFYFGCQVRTGEAAANAALQCTITVSGFVPKTNQEVAVGSFTFTPPESPVNQVPMLHALLPDIFHQGLNNVTIVADNKLAVVLVDDVVSFPEHLSISTIFLRLYEHVVREVSALYMSCGSTCTRE